MTGGSLRSPAARQDKRPTPDQLYLASKINGEAALPDFVLDQEPDDNGGAVKSHRITPAALQRWNLVYGVGPTTDALRAAWGFPPLGGIDNPFAYVAGILRGSA